MPQVDDPSFLMPSPQIAPQQSPANATGFGDALMRLSQYMVNFKAQRQNQAVSELQRNLSAANMGFPVDPRHVEQLMRRAGIKINADSAQAMLQTQRQGTQSQAQPQSMSQGNALAFPLDQKSQGQAQQPLQLNLQDQRTNIVNSIIGRITNAAKARNDSQETQARIAQETSALKEKALGGDKIALGKLQSMGDIPFDLKQEQWNGATDAQRSAMIDIAAGHESQAQMLQRAQGLTDSLISSGRIIDPEMASRAGRILAEGGQLPPDIKGAMKPFTMSELVDQAKLGNELVNAGVPVGQLGRVMAAAETGGIANALPTGLKPIVLQELQLRKGELGLEARRLGLSEQELELNRGRLQLEYNQAQVAGKKLDVELQKEQNRGLLESLQGLVQAKKAGAAIPQEVLDSYIGKIAQAGNLTPTEAKHWWQYVTGGSYTKYVATPDSDLVKTTAGSAQTAPQGGKKTSAADVTKTFLKNLPIVKAGQLLYGGAEKEVEQAVEESKD